MSPSTVDSTSVSSMPRAAAMFASPEVRHAASACEHVLDRCGPVVCADQHCRVIGVDDGLVLVLELLAGAVEAVHRRPVVGAFHPRVTGPELERGDVWLRLDRVEGGEQCRGVDPVERCALGGGGHCRPLSGCELRAM